MNTFEWNYSKENILLSRHPQCLGFTPFCSGQGGLSVVLTPPQSQVCLWRQVRGNVVWHAVLSAAYVRGRGRCWEQAGDVQTDLNWEFRIAGRERFWSAVLKWSQSLSKVREVFCQTACWFSSLANWSNFRPKIPLPLLKMSQQDIEGHLCSSLPPFEEPANSFLLIPMLFSLSTNPTTGSTRGNQQRWQSNSENGSCSCRESSVPPRWRSHWWRRHAGRSGAAEQERCDHGRDGGAVLWVQQQVVLLLWFRHLWGTHQGRAGAFPLHFSPPSHTFVYWESQAAGMEESLVSAAEQAVPPCVAADPPHCCCQSLSFEIHPCRQYPARLVLNPSRI